MTLFACHNQQTEKRKEKSAFPEVYAREPKDSADYKHIKYDFYFSKTGQLCERKLAMARDSSCNCQFEVYYDSTISFFTGDTTIRKPLSSIIDINTFIWLDSTEYAKDKNRVYYFFGNSDGGNRRIVEGADPKTFKRLCEYRWGVDKNNVFYQNKKLEGLNLNKLQVLYSADTSDHFVEYVKDDKLVYHADELLQGADAKTFKVVSGQKWQAEDKNSKYGQSL
ncbi:MAG: DKNYY domain-containing protein [Flavisolibacter sp.]